jgi:hypothetical protein
MANKQQLMDDEGISTSEKVKVRRIFPGRLLYSCRSAVALSSGTNMAVFGLAGRQILR